MCRLPELLNVIVYFEFITEESNHCHTSFKVIGNISFCSMLKTNICVYNRQHALIFIYMWNKLSPEYTCTVTVWQKWF